MIRTGFYVEASKGGLQILKALNFEPSLTVGLMPGNTSVFQTLLCRPNGVPQLIDNAGDDEPDFQRVTTPLMYPG
jgi:hypothetical protein